MSKPLNVNSSSQVKGFHSNKPKGIAATRPVQAGCVSRSFASRQTTLQPDAHAGNGNHARGLNQKAQGFTLLEMAVVMLLIAILTSIAMPSYTEYVVRSKLRTGTESLSAYRSLIEQAYQDNRSYRTADDSACVIASYLSEHFTVTCAASSDLLYVLTASSTAASGLGAGDYVFTIDQDGLQKTTSYKGASVDVDHWQYK